MIFIILIYFGCAGSLLLQLLSGRGDRGYRLAAAQGVLTAVASLAVEHGLWGPWA